jgi:esterase
MLHATRIAASGDTGAALVMLHGIYGRGRNWQGIARALVEARPEYACWLVDLPHHGDSASGKHGDTVRGIAQDLHDWLAAQRLDMRAILGHSYGGKVALAFAHFAREKPLQIWVIDSTPEVKPPGGSAWGMLELIRRLPSQFATRDEAVDALIRGGSTRGVAQWMATNLVRNDQGVFVWRLDFDVMERLLRDFFATDLWPVLESRAPAHDIHVLKASQSSAISPAAVQRLEAIGPPVHLHHRSGGHWIHAESPELVVELLVECLP